MALKYIDNDYFYFGCFRMWHFDKVCFKDLGRGPYGLSMYLAHFHIQGLWGLTHNWSVILECHMAN